MPSGPCSATCVRHRCFFLSLKSRLMRLQNEIAEIESEEKRSFSAVCRCAGARLTRSERSFRSCAYGRSSYASIGSACSILVICWHSGLLADSLREDGMICTLSSRFHCFVRFTASALQAQHPPLILKSPSRRAQVQICSQLECFKQRQQS